MSYINMKITDYHDFSYRGSSKEHRNKLNIGDIYLNAATCHKCNYFIRSRNRHDFVTCSCGNISVDGGSAYIKRVGVAVTDASYTDHIELYTDADKESLN